MPKNIVICCDGTGNQYGKNNTNVVKLFEMLISGDEQKIYYDPGVGTASKLLLRPFQLISTALSQAFGLDLQKNVEDAYYYLMNTYSEGDQIFLFGFSRGAHTVRRLASMLEKVELLQKGSENMISYASRMYLDEDVSEEVLEGFRKTYSRNCPVHFIGVWDTVAAVSRLLPRPKLDGIFSSEVKFAYHAVAIDEKRFNFPPNLWKKDTIADWQTVEEVWFAGVHSDVGGWYEERGLSNITLKWILEKAVHCGLNVREGALEVIKTNPLAPHHESWKGHWWLMPMHAYAALFLGGLYLLEMFVGQEFFRPATFLWDWRVLLPASIVLVFANRKIRLMPEGSKVHKSVRMRFEASESSYKPKNLQTVSQSVEWVE